MSNFFNEDLLTEYFPRTVKPSRVGVYSQSYAKGGVSETNPKRGSGTYGYWDGQKWTKFKSWGDYSDRADMVWQGLCVPTHEVKIPENYILN